MRNDLSTHDCELCKESILYGHQAIIASSYRYGMMRPENIRPHHFHQACYREFVITWLD